MYLHRCNFDIFDAFNCAQTRLHYLALPCLALPHLACAFIFPLQYIHVTCACVEVSSVQTCSNPCWLVITWIYTISLWLGYHHDPVWELFCTSQYIGKAEGFEHCSCIYKEIHLYSSLYLFVCLSVSLSIYQSIYLSIYLCIYVCMYMYIFRPLNTYMTNTPTIDVYLCSVYVYIYIRLPIGIDYL